MNLSKTNSGNKVTIDFSTLIGNYEDANVIAGNENATKANKLVIKGSQYKIKLLSLLFLLSSIIGNAQTPQTPMINWAVQDFPDVVNNGKPNTYRLSVSQGISPRVIRPVRAGTTEKVRIMFLGNWLDFTDEVVITGPGVSSPRGVSAGRPNGGNGPKITSADYKPIFQNYLGVYTAVEFYVSSDAAVGTHTVRLRRPRLGGGKDEAVFYIEVYNLPRIKTIRMDPDRSQANVGNAGFIFITGENLSGITSIGNCNGLLRDIANFTNNGTRISFSAKLAKAGILDPYTILNSVTPANYRYAEYPEQMSNLSQQYSRFTIK
jgi:hypothetical protein